jgi:UDP-glucose 4-epimerase
LGSLDTIDVLSIARIVSKEMRLNPEFVLTGGVDGGRGWHGDVKTMHLDITKVMSLGWKPRFSSKEAISRSARSLVDLNNSQTEEEILAVNKIG